MRNIYACSTFKTDDSTVNIFKVTGLSIPNEKNPITKKHPCQYITMDTKAYRIRAQVNKIYPYNIKSDPGILDISLSKFQKSLNSAASFILRHNLQ